MLIDYLEGIYLDIYLSFNIFYFNRLFLDVEMWMWMVSSIPKPNNLILI